MLSPCSAAVASQDISKAWISCCGTARLCPTPPTVWDRWPSMVTVTDQQRLTSKDQSKPLMLCGLRITGLLCPQYHLQFSVDTLYHPAECRCVVRGCAMLPALSLVAGRRRRE